MVNNTKNMMFNQYTSLIIKTEKNYHYQEKDSDCEAY